MDNIENYRDALRAVQKKEIEQRKTIKKLLQDREELKEQLALYGVVKRTLYRKVVAYDLICKWFDEEYNTDTDRDEVSEMEKKATELNAQIKVLRFIDSTVSTD